MEMSLYTPWTHPIHHTTAQEPHKTRTDWKHLLEDEFDAALEFLLGVDGQVVHLPYQRIKLLRRQLVQYASHLLVQVLSSWWWCDGVCGVVVVLWWCGVVL